jgi:HK97 family phage major capsid protein
MKSTLRVFWIATFAIVGALALFAGIDPVAAHAVITDPQTISGVLMAEGVAAADFDKLRDAVKAALDKIGQDVKEAGEKALAEANRGIAMSKAQQEKIDEMLVKQGELQARQQEIEQKVDRAKDQEKPKAQSVGQLVVESDDFQKWIKDGGARAQTAGFVMKVPTSAVHATMISTPTTDTTTVGVPPDNQPGVIPGTQRRLTVRDMITPGRTSSNMVQFVRESGFTNNAASVSETDKKPQSALTYELTQAPVITIAHFFKASKQILDDFVGLQSQIDARGRYGLKLVEETQLLSGSGVGNNLNGIYTQATAFSAPIVLPGAPRKMDILRLMLLQAELAEYPATAIMLHPADWTAIELTKDTTGAYIFANPQAVAMPMLWGRPVVATQAMTQDTALVGAFMLGAQIFDREDANVVIATQNEDDFVRNIITVRIEERLALAVYRPSAFVNNTNLVAS